MKLSIIIPTKDRIDIFRQTLEHAVLASRHVDAEIIVVNDSSTTAPVIPEHFTNVKMLRNQKSGVASARNLGASKATNELLLFLDNDILISRESIDCIINLHTSKQHACFNLNWVYPDQLLRSLSASGFGRYLLRHKMTSLEGWFNNGAWESNALFAVPSVASFHLSIMREDFERTPGYNEQFPFAGFEDYDFPIQLRKAGLEQFIDSRVTVLHNETDRVELTNWLSNWERRSATRKVAVNMGYTELALKYNTFKKLVLRLEIALLPLSRAVLRAWPNAAVLDFAYAIIVSRTQAAHIYKGYSSL